MALGFSAATGNAILNALCRNTAWSQPAAFYIQLHLGDPGAAGTANPATVTTRKQVTFGSAASGVSIANTVAVTWSAYSTNEDPAYFSAWDASTSGNFLVSGTVTAVPAVAGADYTVAIGALTVSLSAAA